jgi:hypothetical protein
VLHRPVLHIGFPKYASTYIERLLTAHAEVRVERIRIPNTEVPAGSVAIPADTRVYVAINEKVALAEVAESASAIRKGSMFERGEATGVRFDPGEIAGRLKVLYPDARVLMVVREQAAWLDSAYRYYLPRLPDNRRTFDDFLESARGRGYRKAAFYDRTIQAYGEIFGWQNLGVARFEALSRDRTAFAADLCGYLGVVPIPPPARIVNPSSAPWVSRMRRRFPVIDRLPAGLRCSLSTMANLYAPKSGSFLTGDQRNRIESEYAGSNARTRTLLSEVEQAGGTVIS